MTINELRAKRNQAWEAAKAFVETKRNSDGLLSDEDAKTYATVLKSSEWKLCPLWTHSLPSLLPLPSPKSL